MADFDFENSRFFPKFRVNFIEVKFLDLYPLNSTRIIGTDSSLFFWKLVLFRCIAKCLLFFSSGYNKMLKKPNECL